MSIKKTYSHKEILDLLSPYADRGWIERFKEQQNKGHTNWLYVVRDFKIQHPKVEYIVDDIVRSLEPRKDKNSPVRREMEKLASEGKLNLDSPEEEALWEERLENERVSRNEWEEMNEKSRQEQRRLDEEYLLKKQKEGSEISPISDVRQDPAKNESFLSPIEEAKDIVTNEVVVDELVEEVKNSKELSETEKLQEAFTPKPAPDEAPEIKAPTLKSVESNGEKVYDVNDKTEVKPKIDTLGLPKDAVKRLNEIGVITVEDFKKMDKAQAKQKLGQTLYTKNEKLFTS